MHDEMEAELEELEGAEQEEQVLQPTSIAPAAPLHNYLPLLEDSMSPSLKILHGGKLLMLINQESQMIDDANINNVPVVSVLVSPARVIPELKGGIGKGRDSKRERKRDDREKVKDRSHRSKDRGGKDSGHGEKPKHHSSRDRDYHGLTYSSREKDRHRHHSYEFYHEIYYAVIDEITSLNNKEVVEGIIIPETC
ncbi:unnamed protein product [Lactuca saligna]|uniref:Uncharacterized protein n=1 Tax=Lactuca saligna TaxID=75948 RepID=A0AA35YT76_LACSI|nr:unnamed protein product [Lactuca saligna]